MVAKAEGQALNVYGLARPLRDRRKLRLLLQRSRASVPV